MLTCIVYELSNWLFIIDLSEKDALKNQNLAKSQGN